MKRWCRTRERKMTDPMSPREDPGLLLIGRRGPLFLTEEIQGRVGLETTGVHVGGLTQYEGELSTVIAGNGHGTRSLVEGRPPRLAVVHCLGVTDPG